MVLAALAAVTVTTVLAQSTIPAVNSPFAYWTVSATDITLHPSADHPATSNLDTNVLDGKTHADAGTGTKHFRLTWLPPKDPDDPDGAYLVAEEWQAKFKTRSGAGAVTHSFRNTDNDPLLPEMRGTVRLNGHSSLGIQVRGKFNGVWQGNDDGVTVNEVWSQSVHLYCLTGDEIGGV